MDTAFILSSLFVLLVSRLWFSITYVQLLLLLFLIQVLRYFTKTVLGDYKYPAGPISLPVVGCLPWIMLQGPDEFMMAMRRKYGPMMTIRMGSVVNIIVNDYDVIKELSQLPEFQYRPRDGIMRETLQEYGLLNSEGSLWKHQRRFTLHSMRDSGMGTLQMEDKIITEMRKVIDEMRHTQGDVTSIDLLLQKCTCNVIFGLAFNKLYSYEDPKYIYMLSKLNENTSLSNRLFFLALFPWLKPFFRKNLKKMLKNLDDISDVAGDFIKEHRQTLDENNPRDLLDLYLMEIDTAQDDNASKSEYHNTFTEKQLRSIIRDLFLAGTDTGSATTRWAILYMILNLDIQKKVQQELDDVVGKERVPTFADRVHLPYTVATLQEVERMATFVPQGLPRSNNKPATFKQYKFPAGCIFTLNILAVHRDSKLWQEPEKFMPTRFINDEGKAFRPPYLIPFGSGKRSCAGEPLARMEIFLMFAMLMQAFTFEGEPGKIPSDVPASGMSRNPSPYKIRVHDRI